MQLKKVTALCGFWLRECKYMVFCYRFPILIIACEVPVAPNNTMRKVKWKCKLSRSSFQGQFLKIFTPCLALLLSLICSQEALFWSTLHLQLTKDHWCREQNITFSVKITRFSSGKRSSLVMTAGSVSAVKVSIVSKTKRKRHQFICPTGRILVDVFCRYWWAFLWGWTL